MESETPPQKKTKLQQITLSDQLPSSVVATLESLIAEHPGLEMLTVTIRKGGWGVYARHTNIHAVLQGKQRTSEAAIKYIQKWLLQAAPESLESAVAVAHETIEASEWAALMLESHSELAELSATEGDGIITIEALHQETGYSIQRCYLTWNSASADLARWIQSLSTLNTTASAPRRHRSSRPESYDETVRRPGAVGRVAGPGRPKRVGATVEQPHSKSTKSFERQLVDMLSSKCTHLEQELVKSQEQREQLQGQCEQLAAVLANRVHPNSTAGLSQRTAHNAENLFQDAIGVGYSDKELSRTIFNHINTVMATVRGVVGGDAIKALQLCDRVQLRARGLVPTEDAHDQKYANMCINVFQSIKTFLHDLSARYKTKAPKDVKRVMQTVVTALMSHFDGSSQRYLAEQLGLDRSWLTAGKARALSFYEEGLLDCVAEEHQAKHKNRIPGVWRGFCHDHWLASCRAGEKMRDKLRNPKDRSDKELYTIHYREQPIHELYKDCVEQGLEKWSAQDAADFLAFPDDDSEEVRVRSGFKVSERVYRDCKPFHIRTATRDQCLCIWHLRFEYLAEALYNYWKARRESCKVDCGCPFLKTGTALRHHCMCPRPANSTTDKIECVRQACRHCKGLKRLQVCDGCLASFEGHDIPYQIYGQREFVRKRGRAAVDPDFTL